MGGWQQIIFMQSRLLPSKYLIITQKQFNNKNIRISLFSKLFAITPGNFNNVVLLVSNQFFLGGNTIKMIFIFLDEIELTNYTAGFSVQNRMYVLYNYY